MKKRDLSSLKTETFQRIATLDYRAANAESRTVPAALSSETPVERYFGNEVLVHSPDSIDMTRAADGLPLLWNHNTDTPIGVVESLKLKDGKLRGLLRFSRNAKAEEIFSDVREGFLKNISIGYKVDRWEEEANSDTVRVTGWTLLEASVVTVPADASVGIGRSYPLNPKRELLMSEDTNPLETGNETPVVDISKVRREHVIARKAGAVEAIKEERARVSGVHELFESPLVPRNDFYEGLRVRAIDEGWSVEGARKILFEVLAGEAEPAIDHVMPDQQTGIRVATHEGRLPPVVIPAKPGNFHRGIQSEITVTKDFLDKFREGVTEALLVKTGVLRERKNIDAARQGGFVGKRMATIAGDYCRLVGINTNSLSDDDIAGRALAYRSASGQTTSDFTNILANVANKSLLQGWDEAPETWAVWTRRGNLPDFKTAEISGISGFTGLDEVPEDGSISYGKFTDRKETIKLVSYAKKYRITRKLIINDDLQALANIPRAMGRAANRKVGDITYALLNNTGPTLNQDSTALFDTSTHKNYVAAATAPTVSTLNTAASAMKKQTDPNTSAALNIQPRYLLVPVALENTARVLMSAVNDPAGTAGQTTPNPFAGRYEVVTDARLDGQTNGTAAWYLLADPNIYDTVEVAFLDGMAEPYMREEIEWDGQGTSYVVGIDFGVSALDFRGVHKYRGS